MISKLFGIFIAVFMLVSSSDIYAQSSSEIEGKMDEIKLNENMIYGEDFNDNKDIAYVNALSELLICANELRAEKGKEMIKISDLQPVAQALEYSKETRHIVMVYIPLSQMFALTGKAHDDVVPQSPEDKQSQSNVMENRPVADSESETRFTFVPNNSNSNGGGDASGSIGQPAPLSDDILETLCGQDNWTEIKGFLSTYKSQGKIQETGVCTSSAEVPENACSILIDEMYGILSILSPKNTSNRINYRTNLPDTETNYPNCKVIVWYR